MICCSSLSPRRHTSRKHSLGDWKASLSARLSLWRRARRHWPRVVPTRVQHTPRYYVFFPSLTLALKAQSSDQIPARVCVCREQNLPRKGQNLWVPLHVIGPIYAEETTKHCRHVILGERNGSHGRRGSIVSLHTVNERRTRYTLH